MPAVRPVVADDHLRLPHHVRGVVVVEVDGAYVWSFGLPRDGRLTPRGWRVDWPVVLQPLLVGTTTVRLLRDGTPLYDGTVGFRGSSEPLHLLDSKGNRLAVDKMGHLTRVFDQTTDDVRRQVVEGTRKALTDLRAHGFDAHLSYGCLLGAVRDGRMIGHDSDADLAYLSRFTTPAEVMRESYEMERTMRRLGWRVLRMSGADLKLFHPLTDGRTVHIDIFGAFHVNGVFYQLGARSGRLPREALTPASTVTLEGVELPAPADPERVLAFLYGPSWRVPDPAFQNVDPPEGIRRLDGWLRGTRTHVTSWNELLRDRGAEVPTGPSTFARWVAPRVPAGSTITELGSGTGRDAAWLVAQGHPVRAYDFAGAAIRKTRGALVKAGSRPADVRPLALNDRRSVLLAGAELSRVTGEHSLYARGLVGCLDDEARRQLWLLARMSLRSGGSLFLEFAGTAPGAPPSPPIGLHDRVDARAVIDEITASGGLVRTVEHLVGEDFFGMPDPAVVRIEAHWPSPAPEEHP